MKSLEYIQSALHRAIAPGLSSVESSEARDFLQHCGALTPEQSLAIYRNNVQGSLLNALRMIYPVCNAIVGEKAFTRIGMHFLRVYPSGQPDLNRYGKELSRYLTEWLRQQPAYGDLPYLSELAALEWHWHAAHYAGPPGEVDEQILKALAGTDPECIIFRLNPDVSILDCEYPVLAIWESHREGIVVDQIDGLKEREYLLIQRPDNVPIVSRIGRSHFHLLDRIAMEDSLSRLLDQQDLSDVTTEIPRLLGQRIISLKILRTGRV